MEYTLESGTKVVVRKRDNDTYDFSLMPTDGLASSFTYRDGEHTKAEWDEMLEFEQLDALREFWLKTDDIL
jgi:hypothetical protein